MTKNHLNKYPLIGMVEPNPKKFDDEDNMIDYMKLLTDEEIDAIIKEANAFFNFPINRGNFPFLSRNRLVFELEGITSGDEILYNAFHKLNRKKWVDITIYGDTKRTYLNKLTGEKVSSKPTDINCENFWYDKEGI